MGVQFRMRKRKQDISVTIIILSSSLQTVLSNVPVFSNEKSYKIQNETRRERFFNLFQVVTFPNSECTGTNGDKGTCLSRSECQGSGVSGHMRGNIAIQLHLLQESWVQRILQHW